MKRRDTAKAIAAPALAGNRLAPPSFDRTIGFVIDGPDLQDARDYVESLKSQGAILDYRVESYDVTTGTLDLEIKTMPPIRRITVTPDFAEKLRTLSASLNLS
jgi:hypothetical protein